MQAAGQRDEWPKGTYFDDGDQAVIAVWVRLNGKAPRRIPAAYPVHGIPGRRVGLILVRHG